MPHGFQCEVGLPEAVMVRKVVVGFLEGLV